MLHASLQQLASELDLILLLHRARRHDESGVIARIHELSKDDAGLMRLLTSGLSESFSNAMGSVVCSVERSLWYWDELNTIIGHEAFEARIRELDSRRNELILDARGVLALDTALRYLQGFRPKNDTLFKKSALTDSESSDVVDIDDEESDDLT